MLKGGVMIEGLATLIRVNKWTVDELRRELAARLTEMEELELTLVQLEGELRQEQHKVAASPEVAGFFYGYYAEAVIQRRTELQSLIMAKEDEVNIVQEQLSGAYRELKKYEVVHEKQKRQAAKDRARADQNELDELGLQTRYFRKRWQ